MLCKNVQEFIVILTNMLIFVIWCSCLILVVLLMMSSIVCKKDMLDNGLGNAKELNMRLGLELVVGVHE